MERLAVRLALAACHPSDSLRPPPQRFAQVRQQERQDRCPIFIWLTTPDLNPSDTALSPWTVTFAQTTNGTSATPKFNQTSASSNVMHVGGICTNGIFCTVSGGNRDLADSISIAIDRGGSAALVWTDQGNVLHGPTHITYGCVTWQQSVIAGATSGLSCKGPAGP